MSYFRDYDEYYEPSDADKIINEAKDKLAELILTGAKNKVDEIMKHAEGLKECNKTLQAKITQVNRDNCNLLEENKKLKEKLARKHTKLELPYEIDQEVYVVYPYGNNTIKCPACNGTGSIMITSMDGKEYKAHCPCCQHIYSRLSQTYSLYQYIRCKIEEIEISYQKNSHSIEYYCSGGHHVASQFVFDLDARDAAVDCAAELTNKAKAAAEDKLNGVKV